MSKYVYPYSYNEAKRTGEIDLYNKSLSENIRCAMFIYDTIDANFDGYHLKKDVAKAVTYKFGYNRVNFVLANTVQLKSDGRFSRENKEWAKSIHIPENKIKGNNANVEFIITSHPAVLDGFINQVRAEYQKLNLWNFSHCNDKTHLDFTGKVMVLNPIYLIDEYKTPKDQLVLCEGGFGASPNAVGRKVYGRFLSDGEKCQYERSDFLGELKAEYMSEWAKEKLLQLQKPQNFGGIEMN